jgi:hypothetical protein
MSNLRSNIDQIDRFKTVLDGSERIPMRDNIGDLKTTFDSVVAYISAQFPVIPIAGIVDYASDFPNAPDLPDVYHLCDGTFIDDEDSVLDGFRAFNLNGADVVLTLTWTADAGGAYATVDAADLPALAVDDWVSGAGIAAGSMIKDITAGVVTISDIAATGSISTTFTNDGMYTGGGQSGGSAGDQMQGHKHIDPYAALNTVTPQDDCDLISGFPNIREGFGSTGRTYAVTTTSPYTDTVNGTPRTGTRTRPHTKFVQKAMRIK